MNNGLHVSKDEIHAAIRENLPKCEDSYEDLLLFTITLVAKVVVRNAIADGVEHPNAGAVVAAATEHILETWRTDMPHLWDGYIAEIGPDLEAIAAGDLRTHPPVVNAVADIRARYGRGGDL